MLNTGNLIGKHQTSHELRGNDLYETSPVAVEALLKHIELPLRIWEPACGKNLNIVNVLRKHGHYVAATDLIDYKWSDNINYVARGNIDFLSYTNPFSVGAIVTNPPYKLAHEFIRHARKTSPLTIMLLRLAFIESKKRSDILDSGDLKEILVFSNRLPMMHLDGYEGKRAPTALAFAWFVWDRSYQGSTTIKRITWEKNSESI